MPHGHQLINQSLSVASLPLLTLGARSALVANNELGALTTAMLCKRVRYFLQLSGITSGDEGPMLVGLAHGNASVSEIEAAMTEHNPFGPEDVSQTITQTDAWIVWQDSIVQLIDGGNLTFRQTPTDWMKLGKRGLPALEVAGVQAFIFNAGNGAVTTGSILMGTIQIQGVWLRG